ncbi:hypothetical protein Q7C36_018126 [Tachysurus vachellii]|uniref:Uncharacterized protein n=1 Tax=Tachysurus vachellii TaxID=175792 RepID=A0AA88S300_TACVA|nr:hypothetical protein Q7C36_018126 [Tachysurus vachellii]
MSASGSEVLSAGRFGLCRWPNQFNDMPAAVASRCGVCDPNPTSGSVTDPGAEPGADMQPKESGTYDFISTPAHF